MFPLRFCESPSGRGDLEARADPQLLIRARQVPLHRLLGDEQRLGDLAIRATLRRLPAHPPLGRGERIRPGELEPRAAPRAGLELGSRGFDEGERTAPAGQLDRPPFGNASLAAPAGAAELAAEIGERIGELQLRPASLEGRDRLLSSAGESPSRLAAAMARSALPSAPGAPTLRASVRYSRATASACSCSPAARARALAARGFQSDGQ